MAFPEPPVDPGTLYTDSDGTIWVWDGDDWNRRVVEAIGTYQAGGSATTASVRLTNPGLVRQDLTTQEDLNQYFGGRLDGLDAGVPDVDLTDYATVEYVDSEIAAIDITGESNAYRLESDGAVSPQIQLVDQNDLFTNVHFSATGDLTVSADPNLSLIHI